MNEQVRINVRIPDRKERKRLLSEAEANLALYAAQKAAFDLMWEKMSLDLNDPQKDKARAWFCMGWNYREGLGK